MIKVVPPRIVRLALAFILTIPPAESLAQQVAVATASDYAGPIRIAKLLWKGNGKNAASTLRNAFNTSLDRDDVPGLVSTLKGLAEPADAMLASGETEDPRYAVALAIAMLLHSDAARLDDLPDLLNRIPVAADRELVWRVWLQVDQPRALMRLQTMLADRHMDGETIAAYVQHALARDMRATGQVLLTKWDQLPRSVQLAVVEPMTSDATMMRQLVEAVRAGVVDKDLFNTNQLRKWVDANQPELVDKLETVWGKIRAGDNAARQALVKETLNTLRSGASGSVTRGNAVFQRVCSQCHQLHGQGFEVGPNITGNGRGNLEQLVSNVLDPSLVIGEAFQAKLVLTTDGQVLSGLKVAETEKYLKLKLQGGKVVELDKVEDIEEIKESNKSLMPEGIEQQLTPQELVDLFAYLSLLKAPGSEDNELIPGTPDTLVAQ